MYSRDNDYNIDHIAKEKLKCIGKLLDVINVVEDEAQLFSTNDTDDETLTQTMKPMMKKHLNLNEYPSYPHTSGRMGLWPLIVP